MYRLTIGTASWFECKLYLDQNYYVHRRDYYYYTRGGIVDLEFTTLDGYEQFKSRWAGRLLSE